MGTTKICRALSFCLTLLMLFSMIKLGALDVSATEIDLPEDTWAGGTILVTLDGEEADSGNVTVTAYRLVSVNTGELQNTDPKAYQPQMPEYTWESGIAGWIHDNYPGFIDTADSNSVQDVFSTENPDLTDADLAEFYGKIEAAITRGEITGLPSESVTASDNAAVIEHRTMGIYLVTATGGTAVYRPSVASIAPKFDDTAKVWKITQNPAVALKSSPVALVKTITAVNGSDASVFTGENGDDQNDQYKRAVAGVGDTVSYKLTVDVPVYPSQSVSKKFTITDTLPAGLTLQTDSIKVVDQNNQEIVIPEGKLTTTASSLTINLDDSDLIIGKTAIIVTYDAVVNSGANLGKAGNVNTAKLIYSNNPYQDNNSRETKDTAKVFTFGIELTKVEKNNSEKTLSGALFELKDADGNIIQVAEGTDGAFVKDAQGTAVLTTGENGKLTIKGLAPGTYTLKETKAPAGYVLSSAEISVEIQDENKNGIIDSKETPPASGDGAGTSTPITEDNGLVSITVENTKGFSLPQTGGAGTVLFSMIGILLMGGGILLVAVFLRKRFSKVK